MLYGRDGERAQLAALVEAARSGHAGVLLVRGEPGVGKSALLDDLVSGTADLSVLRTQGLESESPLAFAALQRLLRPAMDHLEALPTPQGHALRVAFGEQEGAPVEPFLVGVATLSLLTEAAEGSAVLCVVDDAHWLDTASAGALLFAARRLQADRVAMVFAARDAGPRTFAPDDVPTMTLSGLAPDAVRALLAHGAGHELADAVSERLLAETGGNPLALVELPGAMSRAQLDGTSPLPAQLLLTEHVERVFLDRCRRLPPEVQTLLLLAAADDTGQIATLRRAVGALGVDDASLVDAERSGLLVVEADVVRVQHPLVRSAVYQAATSLERRQAHRALAEAVAAADDPDRETWHRAAATQAPDEHVAEALDTVGTRAERRGGFAAAAAAYERAAEMSATEQTRAPRLFAAARDAWGSGQATRARSLASVAREQADNPLLRADIDRLRARIEVYVGSATDAHRIFTQAAGAVAGVDHGRALEMGVAAAVMSTYGADSGAVLDVDVILANSACGDTPRTRCLRQLLRTLTLAGNNDVRAAVAALDQAVETGKAVEDLDVLGNLGNTALNLGRDEAARRSYSVMLSSARERGAGMMVVYALQRLAFTQLLAGQWTQLRASAEEALTLSRSVGQKAMTAPSLAWLTLLAALQGRADYDGLLAELDEVVASHPLGILTDPVHDLTRWAKGTRATHDSDPAAALHHLSQLRLPTLSRMAAPDRIEAAVRAGDSTRATMWVDELAPFGAATQWPWALATLDFGHAMRADEADAAGWFESALAHHRDGHRPYDQARTQLAYGELLRRTQRRVDARTHLRAALETFADLGADPLVERATQELRASGETARKRDPSTLLDLTPMELKVAQLVSTGLSNK
ncbi:MAG: AAA family ATPase, partial [Marmoricola sp.]